MVLKLLDVFYHVVHPFCPFLFLHCIFVCIECCIFVCTECCISSRRVLPLPQSSGLEVIDNAVTSKLNQTRSKSTSSTVSLTHKCCYHIIAQGRHLCHNGKKTSTSSQWSGQHGHLHDFDYNQNLSINIVTMRLTFEIPPIHCIGNSLYGWKWRGTKNATKFFSSSCA